MSRKKIIDLEYAKELFKLLSWKHTERIFNYIIKNEPCMAEDMLNDLNLNPKTLHDYLNKFKKFDLVGQQYDRRYIVSQRGHEIIKWIEILYKILGGPYQSSILDFSK